MCDDEVLVFARARCSRRADEGLGGVEDRHRAIPEGGTSGGQFDPASRSADQRDTEVTLEGFEGAAHCLLSELQLFRGAGDVQVLGHRDELSQAVGVDQDLRHSVSHLLCRSSSAVTRSIAAIVVA